MSLNRRKFVKRSSLISGGICSGLIGLSSSCTPVTYLDATLKDQALVVTKSQWGETDFVLIKHPKLKAPIYLSQQGEGYQALLLECTHKRCEVRPASQILKCPCHGSEFSNQGKVLHGPAEADLINFTTWHDENYIYLQ